MLQAYIDAGDRYCAYHNWLASGLDAQQHKAAVVHAYAIAALYGTLQHCN
jgi:hypothetical protein